MKFTATLEIEVADDALRDLVRKAGVPLPGSDTELATLMMAMTHAYRSARTFLLTQDHTPMVYGDTYQLTDPNDPAFNIMLTLNQGFAPCPDPKPSSPAPRKPGKATATSPLPSTVRSTKPTTAPRRPKSSARSPKPRAR